MGPSETRWHLEIRHERLISDPSIVQLLLSSLAKKVGFVVGADGTIRAVINEKVGSCGTRWEALEVEEKSSPVASTI